MGVYLVVSSEDMSRLEMSHSVVRKMVVAVPTLVAVPMLVAVPSRYMVVSMANTRVHREMRSSHGGSNKEGEEESSRDLHGLVSGSGQV